MTLTLKQLQAIDTEAQWFELSENDLKKAKSFSLSYSNFFAQNNAYLNLLCLSKVQQWLQDYLETEENIERFPDPLESEKLWQFINGTAITINQTRFVIIPSEDLDTDLFSVPQEWVDIPEFIADYYLAVQINVEERYLRIWGFTTHKIIKKQGDYDDFHRTYSLENDQMITDLEAIWLAIEMHHQERAKVNSLPPLLPANLQSLFHQLSQPFPYSPRLEIPFVQWGAILSNAQYRQQLYQLSQLSIPAAVSLATASEKIQKTVINLSQWLQDQIITGWDNLESLISPDLQLVAVRSDSVSQKQDSWLEKGTTIELPHLKYPLILGVAFKPLEKDQLDIWVELYPSQPETLLPAGLEMQILDEENTAVMQTISKENSPYLRFHFSGQKGDNFAVKLMIENQDIEIIKSFMV